MKIVKMGYSGNPWRLVNDAGAEMSAPERFEHPDKAIGWTVVNSSVSGRTKAECTDKALALMEVMHEMLKKKDLPNA